MIPVLPALVGEMTGGGANQTWWYTALALTFGVMQFFCMPILGALSDRFGRRPVLLLSITGLGLNFLATALAQSPWMLLVSRIWGGATSASFSVANAYVADITPAEGRGKAFGMLGAAFGIGFVIGPLLGGVLSEHSLRLPFFAAAAMSLINALYGYFVLPESLDQDKRTPFSFKKANPAGAFIHLWQLKGVGGLIAVLCLSLLAQFMLHTSWALAMGFRFHWTPKDIGYSLFIVGVVGAVVQGGLQGKLLKAFGESKLALMGLASSTLAFLGFGLATAGWVMYVIIAANFLASAAGPAMQAIISRAVGPKEQGMTMGSLSSLQSLMLIAATALNGPIMSHVAEMPAHDWRMGEPFFIGAALQSVALLLAIVHFRRLPQPVETVAA
ncbi:MFS transporter [Burkholderiaceae bacterium DAT-1]|nr:MFS transporter [Burkholderiaceae bacterium DAT-1]